VPTARRHQILIAVALVALAFNLRPAATSVGPVLQDIRSGLGLGPITAGVLTTLPVLCFAAFGALAPAAARAVGAHRLMLTSLGLLTAGLGARAIATSEAVFFASSVAALAAMATANVLLPSLVKQHFAHSIGLMTGIYTTALAIGLTCASALTVPVASAVDSWRGGLGVWALTALVAALPWLGLLRHDVKPEIGRHAAISTSQVLRSPLAWAMAAFFGLQSLQAYAIFGWLPQIFRDAGFSASSAGLLLGLTAAIGIPISFVLPRLAVRLHSQTPLVLVLCASYIAGYVGLILWPVQGAVLEALAVGIGLGLFPVILTLISLRARTSDGTAALSGFTQSVGYLIAAVGPFLVGTLYGSTGAWTVPLILLSALVVGQAMAGLLVARPRYLEDEIAGSSGAAPGGSGTEQSGATGRRTGTAKMSP
jgi:MFS transporter, CP family, cyanate transporter